MTCSTLMKIEFELYHLRQDWKEGTELEDKAMSQLKTIVGGRQEAEELLTEILTEDFQTRRAKSLSIYDNRTESSSINQFEIRNLKVISEVILSDKPKRRYLITS